MYLLTYVLGLHQTNSSNWGNGLSWPVHLAATTVTYFWTCTAPAGTATPWSIFQRPPNVGGLLQASFTWWGERVKSLDPFVSLWRVMCGSVRIDDVQYVKSVMCTTVVSEECAMWCVRGVRWGDVMRGIVHVYISQETTHTVLAAV